MDKTVEAIIIIGLVIIAAITAWLTQWDIVTVIVAGLIGFLSHGVITPASTSAIPEKPPEEGA